MRKKRHPKRQLTSPSPSSSENGTATKKHKTYKSPAPSSLCESYISDSEVSAEIFIGQSQNAKHFTAPIDLSVPTSITTMPDSKTPTPEVTLSDAVITKIAHSVFAMIPDQTQKFDELKSLISAETGAIRSEIGVLNAKVLSVESALIDVKSENDTMKTVNTGLQTEIVQLRSDISDLNIKIDEQEQYSRRMCLRISGISDDTGDPTENVESKILKLVTKANIALEPSDIDKAHRLGRFQHDRSAPGSSNPSNRLIIVKFTNSKARQRLLDARKTMPKPPNAPAIYIAEDITRFRQNLAFQLRQLVRDNKIQRTWIAGGNVYARRGESDKLLIRSQKDVDKLKAGSP